MTLTEHGMLGVRLVNEGPLAREQNQANAAKGYLDELIQSVDSLCAEAKGLLKDHTVPEEFHAKVANLVQRLEVYQLLVQNNSSTVIGTLENFIGKFISWTSENQSLISRVWTVEGGLKLLKVERDAERELIMLGQSAFLVDEAAVQSFGVNHAVARTVKQIAKASTKSTLSAAQEKRWNNFKRALQVLGWNEDSISNVGGGLKDLRGGVAYGFEGEADKVKVEDLMRYAEKHLKPRNVENAKRMITLASTFGSATSPLRLTDDIAAVLSNIVDIE
jgi:hypothetical protein